MTTDLEEQLREQIDDLQDKLNQCQQYADTMLDNIHSIGFFAFNCINHPNSTYFPFMRKGFIDAHERAGKDTTHLLAQLDEPDLPYEPTEEELAQHG